MISDFPTLNGMLTCRPVKMIISGDIQRSSYNPNSCRVFAEIHEKSRNNVADHTVPADVLLADKWEFNLYYLQNPLKLSGSI